jgi:hypothetical protein
VPSWPVNIFPYIFLGYLAIGLVWFMVLRARPDFAKTVKRRVTAEHDVIAADLDMSRPPTLEKAESRVVA